MNLIGKTALLTGGTGQLGAVVAETFIATGIRVATSYLFENELKYLSAEFKKNIYIARADVTNEQDVIALFHEVKKKFGNVEILVNIVGGFLPKVSIAETMLKDWDRMISMNLKSVFLCSREFLKNNTNKEYGRIISMAAMPALIPSAGRGPYAVSKGGVVTLTKILGEELKGTGTTANAIAPSIIKTKPNVESMPGVDYTKWVTPEEIANTILYLCSDGARSINGLTIPMIGGV